MRDGHLDHGYAITAHRAQGATVDRAFVLGSDELYREWGYTALSRHRDEARFYVSATPTFLNETPPPLQAGEDVARRVADARGKPREAPALNGTPTDHRATSSPMIRRRRLAAIEQRLDALRDELEATGGTGRAARRGRAPHRGSAARPAAIAGAVVSCGRLSDAGSSAAGRRSGRSAGGLRSTAVATVRIAGSIDRDATADLGLER